MQSMFNHIRSPLEREIGGYLKLKYSAHSFSGMYRGGTSGHAPLAYFVLISTYFSVALLSCRMLN